MAEANAPVKRRKTLLLVVGIVLLLVLIAAAVAFFLIRNKQLEAYAFDSEPAVEQEEKAPRKPPVVDSSKHLFFSMEMFTVNLADRDRDRFAQVAVVVEVSDIKAETALKAIVPIVRSETLLLITSKTVEDLMDLKGKQQLAQQILEITRKRISPDYRKEVHAVHFANFVIQ